MKRFAKRVRFLLRRWLATPRPENYSEIDLLHALLCRDRNPGRVMVDVGAQFGESFAPFQLFGWRILAFEPDLDVRKQQALALHEKSGARVVRRALADLPGEGAAFYTSEVSTGISALAPFHESHRLSARVPVSTLAIELAEENLPRVDFLKIDTEGHDLFVLRGFDWRKERLRPRAILCEFEDAKTRPLGYSWRDMADFLVGKGYHVLVSEWKPITRYGARHDWLGLWRYPGPEINPKGWGNLIALSASADVDWVLKAAVNYSRV